VTLQAEPSFLELVRQRERGKLKLYIGSAAGTGKTYRMLQEAHDMRRRSVGVVIGFVETHGRSDTQAQINDLEVVPCNKIVYRGVTLEEMDVDAVIERRPQVALVDELAHTNVPGSRNDKRWQDVMVLLDEGINVVSAVNVQHLESLNDVIQRTLGVTGRETVPDWVVGQADQVVNLDISAEDLRQRLREGKIYRPDKIQAALDRRVDAIGALLGRLDVHTVPVGIETPRDSARLAEQDARQRRIARHARHDPVYGLPRWGRAAILIASDDRFARPIH
jgi:two-component system sensor histidine kinase KdpD